ncbi:hypothetical protein PBI_JUDY_70 [Arthrobacter phage Judy]|uniref:Uncharacterized protein n=1 Tax=Arthrobacter phage Judy TaxID=2419958 RepID=A0A3G2KGN0_9CAUD|nr:hypothetical protein HOU50_gp70 [Arthrobacter phage Judy]AYN58142.1 hypothetical protein PBI_JUDY_70 [Arthrobacter phage Judy]
MSGRRQQPSIIPQQIEGCCTSRAGMVAPSG